MPGQPNYTTGPNPISFDVTSKFIHTVPAGGIPDAQPETNILNPGETVHIHTTVAISGSPVMKAILAAALSNPAVGLVVRHHIENLHTGARIEQDGGNTFAVTVSGATIISPPFTVPVTGVATSPNETPYKVVTTVQAGGVLSGIVAGFIDGPVLMAVQP